ncbi:MAG: flotillin-like protein FloA [Clostridia bacterium]|nr:flotillin-like protein FloA [Clostridia bacterium]
MINLLSSNVWLYVGVTIGCLVIVFLAVLIGMIPMKIYLKALFSGTPVSPLKLISMQLRRLEVSKIVDAYITARKGGVKIKLDDLETHLMAGGDIVKVVEALITARGAKIDISVDTAKAIDLANRDILKAVQSCVSPVVITSPPVSAVAKDGIELLVKVKVTVKTNINTLIGGAGEDTILARVGEGVVTTVGSAATHSQVLENPDIISKMVFNKGLDKGTAFEILSIDIADIDVGKNIGARLMAEKAEADSKIANARAEERRAMAIASEQEMKARTQEMKARLLDAEAEVPMAISSAFRSGHIGVMDYYRMKNINADSEMKTSIAHSKALGYTEE